MIEEIASDLLGKLNFTPSNNCEEFVGMEYHIAMMSNLMHLESEEVRMVGIWGPLGAGKTTIARALYGQLCPRFQCNVFIDRAFISKSKEIYNRGSSDNDNMKLHLQGNFLSEILGEKDIKVDHPDTMRNRLKHQKVLIVIDDLDDQVVLDALVGKDQWFGSGSRIIVVTTDKHLLKAHKIDHVYEVCLPSEHRALEMLCLSAFSQNSPPEGFEKLAVEVTGCADRLPLALNVLGSSLRGKKKEYWTDMLPRLRNGLDDNIEKTLRFSYDELGSEEDKVIFRHIACLFNGWSFTCIKRFLENSVLGVNVGLENLFAKSLIHYRWGKVEMHRLLEELGKKVVRKQSIHEPREREFLTDCRDICEVLNGNISAKKVLGISLSTDEIDELHVHENAFKEMPNLQFLTIELWGENGRVVLPESFDYLPPKLKLLCWDRYPKRCMPSKFCPEFLVELNMRFSKLEKLWNGVLPLTCLTKMDLSGSENLKEIPNLSKAINLETLHLNWCSSLVKLPPSIGNLHSLTELSMYKCTNLKILPTGINLKSLENLDLSECWQLRSFPDISTNISNLNLDQTGIKKVPPSIGNLHSLTELSMQRCRNLEILPTGINLESLVGLHLNGCSKLSSFPDISTNISQLYLTETGIEEVPWWIEKFAGLCDLHMNDCRKLKFVSLNITKLKQIGMADFSNCGELAGFHLSGYKSDQRQMEEANIDTKSLVSSFLSNSSKLLLNFNNCFNLDQDALLKQQSLSGHLTLSGEEVPLYFTHQTTGTSSLTIPLLQTSLLQQPSKFRTCFTFEPISINQINIIISMKVNWRFKGRPGNQSDSADQLLRFYEPYTESDRHLVISDYNFSPPQLNYDQVDIQLSSKNCTIKGWGIRLVGLSLETEPGNPNILPHVCEANMVSDGCLVTEQGVECEGSRGKHEKNADYMKKRLTGPGGTHDAISKYEGILDRFRKLMGKIGKGACYRM